ncbi:MAG: hypothetical protein FJ104_01240 [Deltaproteobacteria bacterium]|nr:hypothetical protein [Deltaproteobacteria bacterium]
MSAQRLFAHYPSLFVTQFDQSLVIGLGTGTTLGSVLTYPWKRVDVAEISPAMVDAAATHFGHVNRDALSDPRVRVIVDDARNYLLVTREKYDFISMELSSIWFAGAASLYSREYYRLVHEHLARGGIFQQWVQLHHVKDAPFATILNTLHAEFAHVALFVGGQQGILVASGDPLAVSAATFAALEQNPSLRSTLPEGRSIESLLDDVVLAGDGLLRYLDETAGHLATPRASLVSTDDNLYLEYETPRGNVLPWAGRDAFIARLRTYRRDEDVRRLVVR